MSLWDKLTGSGRLISQSAEALPDSPGLTKLDRDSLARLLVAGADPEQPHRVDHFLRARDRATADALSQRCAHEGWQITRDQGREYVTPVWAVTASRVSPIDVETLSEQIAAMERLCDDLGADYAGWGAAVEPRTAEAVARNAKLGPLPKSRRKSHN